MITADKIKALVSEFKFTALKEKGVTTYYLVRKSDGEVMYKTKCPVSIAVLFADFEIAWVRPDEERVNAPSRMDPGNEFLSLDVRESMRNFNRESFLCLFGKGIVRDKPYKSNYMITELNEYEFRSMEREIVDYETFVRKLRESKTMEEIVRKILRYYWKYSWES